MRIGELAAQTGVSLRALRHYDALGLLASTRTENRYRQFTPQDVERVRLIRVFLGVGFRLEEIRDYGPCWQGGHPVSEPVPPAQARAFYERKLTELDAQLSDLQAVRQRLASHLDQLENL